MRSANFRSKNASVKLLKSIHTLRTNRYARLMFKTTCALDDKMELYNEVMK